MGSWRKFKEKLIRDVVGYILWEITLVMSLMRIDLVWDKPVFNLAESKMFSPDTLETVFLKPAVYCHVDNAGSI